MTNISYGDCFVHQFAEFFRLKAALTAKLDNKPVKILKRLPSVYFIVKGEHSLNWPFSWFTFCTSLPQIQKLHVEAPCTAQI